LRLRCGRAGPDLIGPIACALLCVPGNEAQARL
jgi:hypothetical protein